MIDMPGYKPVRCGGCDEQVAWVKEDVESGMLIRAKDGLLLDGEKPAYGTAFPRCTKCPSGTFNGGLKI